MPRSSSLVTLRRWLSPLAAALFVIVSLSGILLHSPGMHVLHEYSAYLFIAVCLAHLGLNWRPFRDYLRQGTAWAALGLCALLAGGFVASGLAERLGTAAQQAHERTRPSAQGPAQASRSRPS